MALYIPKCDVIEVHQLFIRDWHRRSTPEECHTVCIYSIIVSGCILKNNEEQERDGNDDFLYNYETHNHALGAQYMHTLDDEQLIVCQGSRVEFVSKVPTISELSLKL